MYESVLDMAEFIQPSKHRYNLKTRFHIVKSLGQGTYGKVKMAIDRKTGEKVGLQVIFMWAGIYKVN